ncbi:hypothetical protein AtubIFM55763_001728 [Aspergillus tubingensis]|nr:hypothetical protein AtubIFM55763_001728 [Aspergillus tubingensis]
MESANQHTVSLLEAERIKFDGKDYTPPPRLMQRCKAAFRLLKSDLSKQPRQTRQRNTNAQKNLAAIFEKSVDVFVLRSLTSTLSQLGSKREYGLAPILIRWWTGVQHPQSLSNISRDLCAEFGLQYLENANISKTTYQDARVPEVSTSDGLDLVTTGMGSNDDNLFHEGENPEDSPREGFPTTRHPFGMARFLDSEYGNQRMPDQYHAQLDRRDENPLQVTTPRSAHDMNQLPRPENQPLQSVLPFQKFELLEFFDSPENPWGRSTLSSVLPSARQDLRLLMPWSGTPLPCLEVKLEVPIEFSEAFMKFRQSRLGVGNIEQKAAHKNDNSGLALE